MPSDNIQHRKRKRRTTFVLIPGDESGRARTVSAGKAVIAGVVSLGILLIAALTLAVVVYTPAGMYLPIVNPELENKYGRRIIEIQDQLHTLTSEMVMLQEYNIRLRKVLGENVSDTGSSYVAQKNIGSLKSSGRVAGDSFTRTNRFAQPVSPQGSDLSPASSRNMQSSGYVRQIDFKNVDNFPLSMPTLGYFTRVYSVGEGHFGVDIAGKEGSPVVAAAAGNVIFADWEYDYGYIMIIAHARGYMTVYKHNQALLKNVGSAVKRGELIAMLGNTGRMSSGPHLHFEVWQNGIALDPTNYLITSQ